MEVSTATLQPSCSFPLRAPKPATRERVSSLSSIRSSPKSISVSYSITKGCDLVVREPVKLRWSSVVAATVGDTTAVPNSCSSGEELPVSDSSNPISVEDQPSGNGEKGEEKGGIGGLDDHKMARICDKLIEVFLVDKPTPTDWRRLLAFSKEWDDIRPHFYARCQDRADAEDDPGMKHKLLRLGRKLKEIDEDVQRHNELLKVVRGAQSEISEIVSRRRKDFTQEFFVHLHTVAESYYNNPTEQTALASIGNKCLVAVKAYDSATESIEAQNAAELKFQDIINSPTVDATCRKINHLAEKNQLDSSVAKESSMTKDKVKDLLYHLYVTARGNLQRSMPKEIRILKYLLTIEDPEELLAALHDPFTPGEELEGTDMKAIVDAYHFSQESTLIRGARDLMNPKIIQKMEELKKLVEHKFL
ncbi:hypothetical protein D8674_040778 [Pyrus ussuriensis x Pyrus communis]|uniref:Uncharacterized protein n=1 Tax=Pyrus ussuriensis x Pyrus communis TaxID=2448454 RepID=A0A5N5IH41_9ROSA|nr:hypothetical protein D8674_040778 [Pyrus ussuriensis x Pyrus communis]